MNIKSMSRLELEAYVVVNTYKSYASYLPKGYFGSASGRRIEDYGKEPKNRIIKALKLLGYTYNRQMGFWD